MDVNYTANTRGYDAASYLPRDDVDLVDVIPLNDVTSDVTNTSTNVTCSNDYCVSDEEYIDMIISYIYPEPFEWCLIVLYACVYIIGLVGNFLVCFVVWRNKSMRTVTNYFIVNLSVADFLVLFICLPPTVLEDVTETWYMDNVMCKVIKYLQGVSVSVSVLTLSVISVERYYAIVHPLAFRSTTKRVRILIVIIWIIALCIYAPELYALGLSRRIDPSLSRLLTSCKPMGWDYTVQAAYSLCLTVVLYLLPFCLMGYTYTQIALCLWTNSIPTETNANSSRPLNPVDSKHNFHQQQLARRKVAQMLIAVVIMFGVCYLPVHLLNILRYAKVNMGDKVSIYFALIAHWLCYFNSAINPVIYNFMSAKFQKEFSNTCSCCVPPSWRMRHVRRPTGYHGDSTYTYRYANTMSETEQYTLKTLPHHDQCTKHADHDQYD